jgi:aryl carrier-like protein
MPGMYFSFCPILHEWHALNEFWFAVRSLWLLAVPISLSVNTAWFLQWSYSTCKMLALFNWERQANVCHKELLFLFSCMRNNPTIIISSHSKHQTLQSSNAALMCLCSNLRTEWLFLVLTPWGNIEWLGYGPDSIEWLGYGLDSIEWLGYGLHSIEWLGYGLDSIEWLGYGLDSIEWLGYGQHSVELLGYEPNSIEWLGYGLNSIEWLGCGPNSIVTRLWAAQHKSD